jgi:bifunctional non-homologous end joining protein LigD
VRPTEDATVSAPVTWDEVSDGIDIRGFTLESMPERIAKKGDLFAPLLKKTGRAVI